MGSALHKDFTEEPTDPRAARECVGVGRGDVLLSHCTIHETSCGMQVLGLHALSDNA